jgi:hypothetical protein
MHRRPGVVLKIVNVMPAPAPIDIAPPKVIDASE